MALDKITTKTTNVMNIGSTQLMRNAKIALMTDTPVFGWILVDTVVSE